LVSNIPPECGYDDANQCTCLLRHPISPGSYCFPENVPLPGPDWEALRFDRTNRECPAELTCRWSWSVTPDGSVLTDKEGVQGTETLTAADLAEVDALARSNLLLLAMVEAPPCETPPPDVFISLTLHAGAPAPLEQNVTGCVYADIEDAAIPRLWEIISVY
jgi:hypothetical protein